MLEADACHVKETHSRWRVLRVRSACRFSRRLAHQFGGPVVSLLFLLAEERTAGSFSGVVSFNM